MQRKLVFLSNVILFTGRIVELTKDHNPQEDLE